MHKEYLIDWRLYTCGANGQIYSYYWKKYLSGNITKYGYIQVKLKCIDGKDRMFLWHRVIWTFFNGTIPEGMQVNHIDENKENNTLSNLNLMTAKENTNWGTGRERATASRIGRKHSEETRRKISENQKNNPKRSKPVVILDKDGNIIKEYPSAREASRNGFKHAAECCRGVIKTCRGYVCKYA